MSLLVSKSDRAASQLRDALRITSWNKFKSDKKDIVGKGKEYESNFELYELFESEWNNEVIHQMELPELTKFIEEELEYTLVDLNKIRSDYYESRKQFRSGNSGNSTAIAIANSSVVAPSSVVDTEVIPY